MEDLYLRNLIINDILIPSLRLLYSIDYDNIRMGVSERNICARLAHHMENTMRDYDKYNNQGLFDRYFVDVEYNRMGNGDVKRYENSEHRDITMVSDLLIQSRGEPRNLLAVEMKRSGNKKGVKTDIERLISIVSAPESGSHHNCVYDTLLGAFIKYSKTKLRIDLFEAKDGHGAPCGYILLKRVKNDRVLDVIETRIL